jgi:mRNA interferase RelE/StbE
MRDRPSVPSRPDLTLLSHRYSIEWQPAAERALRKLDKPVARRVATSIAALATNPRPAGIKTLTRLPGALPLRVDDYHVVYLVEDHRPVVLVVTLAHRQDIYRNL